ncbi:hypothetical protein F5B17DRAFT_96661 [Nemania serpens]|nr:hypothetical protein F5B17DRAFT_96661 [Nemania serpens]
MLSCPSRGITQTIVRSLPVDVVAEPMSELASESEICLTLSSSNLSHNSHFVWLSSSPSDSRIGESDTQSQQEAKLSQQEAELSLQEAKLFQLGADVFKLKANLFYHEALLPQHQASSSQHLASSSQHQASSSQHQASSSQHLASSSQHLASSSHHQAILSRQQTLPSEREKFDEQHDMVIQGLTMLEHCEDAESRNSLIMWLSSITGLGPSELLSQPPDDRYRGALLSHQATATQTVELLTSLTSSLADRGDHVKSSPGAARSESQGLSASQLLVDAQMEALYAQLAPFTRSSQLLQTLDSDRCSLPREPVTSNHAVGREPDVKSESSLSDWEWDVSVSEIE